MAARDQGGVVDSLNLEAREPSSLGWLRPSRSRGFCALAGGGVPCTGRGGATAPGVLITGVRAGPGRIVGFRLGMPGSFAPPATANGDGKVGEEDVGELDGSVAPAPEVESGGTTPP